MKGVIEDDALVLGIEKLKVRKWVTDVIPLPSFPLIHAANSLISPTPLALQQAQKEELSLRIREQTEAISTAQVRYYHSVEVIGTSEGLPSSMMEVQFGTEVVLTNTTVIMSYCLHSIRLCCLKLPVKGGERRWCVLATLFLIPTALWMS